MEESLLYVSGNFQAPESGDPNYWTMHVSSGILTQDCAHGSLAGLQRCKQVHGEPLRVQAWTWHVAISTAFYWWKQVTGRLRLKRVRGLDSSVQWRNFKKAVAKWPGKSQWRACGQCSLISHYEMKVKSEELRIGSNLLFLANQWKR